MVEKGHRVTVITGFPNSPSGIVPSEYRGKLRQEEYIDGIRVLRGWLYASSRLNKFSKTLGFASFALSASLQVLFRKLRPDVIIATSPPPTAAIAGIIAAKRHRAPLVVDIRDIWPEAIVNSGELKSQVLVGVLKKIEKMLYDSASAVTVVTEGKKARLIEKGVDAAKLAIIQNGVDLGRFENLSENKESLISLGVPAERFTIIYAGIFNSAQGLEILVDAAKILRERYPEIAATVHFMLVGDGVEKPNLIKRCSRESLEEMFTFVPIQPREKIPVLLCSADAIVVPLAPRGDTHTVPSKIYESMASAKPVLVSADAAPSQVIRAAGAGLATAAGDAEGLSESIKLLASDPRLCATLGSQGRAYSSRCDRRKLVLEWDKVFHGLVRTKSQPQADA